MAGTTFYNGEGNSEWILKRPLVIDPNKYWKSWSYLYPLGKQLDGTGHEYFYVTDKAMFEALLGEVPDYIELPVSGAYYSFPLIPYSWVSDYFENPKEWNSEWITADFKLVHIMDKKNRDCILLPVEHPYVPFYIQTCLTKFTSGRTLISNNNADNHGAAFRYRTVSGSDICRVPADGMRMGIVLGSHRQFISRFPRNVTFTASIYRYTSSTQTQPNWVANLATTMTGKGNATYSQPSAYYDSWIYTSPNMPLNTWANPNGSWRTLAKSTQYIDAVGVGLLTIYTSNAGGTWTATTLNPISSWPQKTSLQHQYSSDGPDVYNAESFGNLNGYNLTERAETWHTGSDGVSGVTPALMIPYSAGVILQAPTMGR